MLGAIDLTTQRALRVNGAHRNLYVAIGGRGSVIVCQPPQPRHMHRPVSSLMWRAVDIVGVLYEDIPITTS